MSEYDLEEPLTSTAKPLSDATITVRMVKSFPYRNVRNHVFQHVDLTKTTAKELFELIEKTVQTTGALRPMRTVKFDTIKIYTHAHGTKTQNLVINLDHDDDWVLDLTSEKPLVDYGVENETEFSVYNLADYLEYKSKPEDKW